MCSCTVVVDVVIVVVVVVAVAVVVVVVVVVVTVIVFPGTFIASIFFLFCLQPLLVLIFADAIAASSAALASHKKFRPLMNDK